MKAIVKTRTGAGGVELGDVDVRSPGRGEVKVAVAAAGICGTDLHIIDGEWPTEPPVVMGHEFSGTVVEVGEGISATWKGANVVVEVLITDGICDNCLRGQRNMCAQRRAIGRQSTFVQLGILGRRAEIDFDLFCLKNITMVTSFAASPRALDRALILLSSGEVAARSMITRVAPLDDWEDVVVRSRAGEGLKFMFDPRL